MNDTGSGDLKSGQTKWVLLAGMIAAAGYGGLAVGGLFGASTGARLVGAVVLGWAAVALAWRVGGGSARVVWLGAIVFRLIGLGVTPDWEDDYFRYLWDGYQLVTTGDPYAEAPLAAFGRAGIPEKMEAVLDGINHPEYPTVYGPAAQAVFGATAAVSPGSFWLLKLGLVMIELVGWVALGRQWSARGRLLALWCPLGVMELAFAGHPEALGVAAVAVAIGWKHRGWTGRAAGAMAVAVATKAWALLLVPFVLGRAGWRGVAGFGGVLLVCYLPFVAQGSAAEWPAVLAMGRWFEYNSFGFAALQVGLGADLARRVAPLLVLAGAGLLGWRWWRCGPGAPWPGAEVMGVALFFSPVVNPWYGLWLLPFLALRPTAWGIGVLVALPLAYAHGFNLPGGAELGYRHPAWVRPTELAVVVAAVAFAGWARHRRASAPSRA